MTSLEEGRWPRGAGRPRLVADVARFFRPVNEMGLEQVVPELVEVERPLNPRGVSVTPDERVEIAARIYQTILDDAAAGFLAARPKDGTTPDPSMVFDAGLAERLGWWSDLWRQAEDAAIADPAARTAAVRNRSARPAFGGARLAGPDARPDTVRSHVGRMTALEEGRSLRDALERAGRPASEPLDTSHFRGFVEVARFFRIEAESPLPPASRTAGAGRDALRPCGRRGPDLPVDRRRGGPPRPGRVPTRRDASRRPPRRAIGDVVDPLEPGPGRRGPRLRIAISRDPVAHRPDGRAGASRPRTRRPGRRGSPPRIRRGRAVLPTGSGLGTRPDPGAMKRSRPPDSQVEKTAPPDVKIAKKAGSGNSVRHEICALF